MSRRKRSLASYGKGKLLLSNRISCLMRSGQSSSHMENCFQLTQIVLTPLHCAYSVTPLHCTYSVTPLHCTYSVTPLHCTYSIAPLHCTYSVTPSHCTYSIAPLH